MVCKIFGTDIINSKEQRLQSILDKIVSYAQTSSDSDHASITLWEKTLEIFCGSSSTLECQSKWLSTLSLRPKGASTHSILSTLKPFIVTDMSKLPFSVNPIIPEYGIKAYFGVPIVNNESPLGVLYLLDMKTRTYSDVNIQFLTELGTTSGEVISHFDLKECIFGKSHN